MATEEKIKQSRRAQRRAASVDESSSEAADDTEASAPVDDDAGATTDEATTDAAPAEPSVRKKKKRPAPEQDANPTAIKDRNKRLRAEAARQRSRKREKERESAAAQGLDASEMMDDALARGTHAATNWLKKNLNILQWVIVVGIAGGIGWQIYSWRQAKTREKTSDQLMAGVSAEDGRVGEVKPEGPDEVADPRPVFKTHNERLAAAEEGYRRAAADQKGTGPGILAELGLAGVLYDLGKLDEAKAAYELVAASPLAKADEDVRLRAIEGVALVLEAKGDAPGALEAFKKLEASESSGFQALSLYHQARLSYAAGKKDAAKELLAKVQEKLGKERSPMATATYLDRVTRELMAAIDPSTAPATSPSASYTPEQLDALKEQILKDPAKLQEMLKEMQKGVKDLTDTLPTSVPELLEAPPEDAPPAPEGSAPAP